MDVCEPNLFSEWLESLARRYGDRLALVCDEDRLSYAELLNSSRSCAMELAERGVKKGDRVVLLALNGLDWVVSFFGIVLAGGVAALSGYSLSGQDVAKITRLVDAKWAILGVDDAFGIQPDAVANALVEGGVSAERVLSCRSLYKTALEAVRDSADFQATAPRVEPRDTQVIVFTSGSSSLPKAVQLSSNSILSDICVSASFLGPESREVVCPALPLFHTYGVCAMMMILESRRIVCLTREIDPSAVVSLIERWNVDTLYSSDALYRTLAEMPEFEERGRGRIKSCFWGGSAMTPADMERLQGRLGGAQILPGYGLSECSAAVSVSTSDIPPELRAVSVGRPLPNLDVRIWSQDRGLLPQGELGEIVVKGPCLMNGYLGLAKDEQPIDEDGWLHTGDIGVITKDGLLQIKGRAKSLIKRASEGIAPADVEEALLEDSRILDAKVMGVPHPILGESIEACVVLRNGEEFDERRLRASMRRKLSPHKIPSHIVAFRSFPLNSNGKVDVLRLKEMLLNRLSDLRGE